MRHCFGLGRHMTVSIYCDVWSDELLRDRIVCIKVVPRRLRQGREARLRMQRRAIYNILSRLRPFHVDSTKT